MIVEQDEEDEKEIEKTLTTTLKIIGKDNIKNDLKDLIDFQMKNIYVKSVKIIDVIANKDVIQSDIYKWTGAKRVNDDIKYFKAWNTNYNYHNFNLDMNNEIAFECVPNALIKSYGNRQAKNREFIAKISKGGTNYIKNVLKSYHQSELDNLKDIYSEEELEQEMKELEKKDFHHIKF